MHITKQEVKTTYDIRFTFAEFLEIARTYNNSMEQHRHPHAFENINLDKLLDSDTTAEGAFKQLFLNGTGDTYLLIANHFGFEGWSNGGYYCKGQECYCMQVYNCGDTMKGG